MLTLVWLAHAVCELAKLKSTNIPQIFLQMITCTNQTIIHRGYFVSVVHASPTNFGGENVD